MTHAHARTHARTHAYIQTDRQTDMHTDVRTYIHAYMHACIMHPHTHARTHARIWYHQEHPLHWTFFRVSDYLITSRKVPGIILHVCLGFVSDIAWLEEAVWPLFLWTLVWEQSSVSLANSRILCSRPSHSKFASSSPALCTCPDRITENSLFLYAIIFTVQLLAINPCCVCGSFGSYIVLRLFV